MELSTSVKRTLTTYAKKIVNVDVVSAELYDQEEILESMRNNKDLDEDGDPVVSYSDIKEQTKKIEKIEKKEGKCMSDVDKYFKSKLNILSLTQEEYEFLEEEVYRLYYLEKEKNDRICIESIFYASPSSGVELYTEGRSWYN